MDCIQMCSSAVSGRRQQFTAERFKLLNSPCVTIKVRSSGNSRTSSLEEHHHRRGYGSTTIFRNTTRYSRLANLTARFRFNSEGGGGNGNNQNSGLGRIFVNVALTGALAYLTVTGKLGWVFDAIISLWLFSLLLPLLVLLAYFWFVQREIITGGCPNCGKEFQVFEFAVKDQLQLCPYCTQPFKVDKKMFVRDAPKYRNQPKGDAPKYRNQPKESSSFYSNNKRGKLDEEGGIVVDVEAEVLDDD